METIKLTINNEVKEFEKGIKLKDIISSLKKENDFDIITARLSGKVIYHDYAFTKSGKLSFYNVNSNIGNKAYERGILFLFNICANEILGKDTNIIVKHSIDKGIFCKIDKKVEEEDIISIKKLMKEKIKKNIPFVRIETTKEEALEYFKSIKRNDKMRTLFYNTDNLVTLYCLEDHYNFLIGELPLSTGVLKYFDLTLIKDKGVVVRFPSIYDANKVIKYTHHENYFNSLEEYSLWGEKLKVSNLGELK